VGDGLDRVLGSLGAPRTRTVAGLDGRWTEIVGAAMAAHTQPIRVRDGVLLIAVDDPVWATEIRWMGTELAARASTILNDDSITRIEVRVRPSGG
jgi:predicted nucleic acid-binding Zn ribbon protein